MKCRKTRQKIIVFIQSKIHSFSTHFYASWIEHKRQKDFHICDMRIPSCYEHFSSVFQASHTFHKFCDICNIPVSYHVPKIRLKIRSKFQVLILKIYRQNMGSRIAFLEMFWRLHRNFIIFDTQVIFQQMLNQNVTFRKSLLTNVTIKPSSIFLMSDQFVSF